MYKDRATNIRERKDEIKKLEEQTKRMQEEIERIRKIKEMQMEKDKLRQEMAQMQVTDKQKKQIVKNNNLRTYADKVKKDNAQKLKKKPIKIKLDNSSDSNGEGDGENLQYFLNVLGLPQYNAVFTENKICTLAKLRQVNEGQAKAMGIPIKDMVKINKKLRTMGF